MQLTHRSVPRLLGTLALLLVAFAAQADRGPQLHEPLIPDPSEDLRFGARLSGASLPAAIRTPGGLVGAPESGRAPGRSEPVYGKDPKGSDGKFQIDGDTRAPARLPYHESFRPGITPFKRVFSFDSVDAQMRLIVQDSLRTVAVRSESVQGDDDEFFADLVVDFVPSTFTRIPTPAPSTRLIAAHLEPDEPLEFWRDRAENWFVRSASARGPQRLMLQLAVPRAAFTARMTVSERRALASALPTLPDNLAPAARPVLARIGLDDATPPDVALKKLVDYFRGFEPAEQAALVTGGAELYQALALSRKGVCRHRAYAFMLTALGWGLPTRFVHNEAHAWVEVFGGTSWHRIDLGGAVTGVDFRGGPPEAPHHRPPKDEFDWPSNATPGSALSPPEGAGGGGAATPTGDGSPEDQNALAELLKTPPPLSDLPPANIELAPLASGELRRGQSVALKGRVKAGDNVCHSLGLEVLLVQGPRVRRAGRFVTDAFGRFSGEIAIPSDVDVGDYDLVVATSGNERCGAGTSR